MSAQLQSKPQNCSLKNLQPIEYLKTFNRILDNMEEKNKNALQPNVVKKNSKQLKTVNLSKFPLPSFYYQMEGIFEANNKKNFQTERQSKKKVQMEKYEKEFMKNHYKFMKGTIERIIKDNEDQQNNLNQHKEIYRKSMRKNQLPTLINLKNPKLKGHYKSEPKFKANRETNRNQLPKEADRERKRSSQHKQRINSMNSEHESVQESFSRKDERKRLDQNQEETHNPIFKKLAPPKKIGRFHLRKESELEEVFQVKSAREPPHTRDNLQLGRHPLMALTERRSNASLNKGREFSKKQSKAEPQINQFRLNQNKISKQRIEEAKEPNQDSIESQSESDDSEGKVQLKDFRRSIKLPIKRDPITKEAIVKEYGEEFFEELAKLQEMQSRIQSSYASGIDSNIEAIHAKINERIGDVRSFKF